MSRFFSNYPKVIYNDQIVTNILTRVDIDFSKNSSNYFRYFVKDGETPESIAFKQYGDSQLHWVILLVNNFIDPQFSFPLSSKQLETYLDKKYANLGGLNYTKITLNPEPFRYRKIITKKYINPGYSDESSSISIDKIFIDQSTYANTSPYSITKANIEYSEDRENLTIYDYEFEINEKKRIIKLVRKEIASIIVREFEIIMGRQ